VDKEIEKLVMEMWRAGLRFSLADKRRK